MRKCSIRFMGIVLVGALKVVMAGIAGDMEVVVGVAGVRTDRQPRQGARYA